MCGYIAATGMPVELLRPAPASGFIMRSRLCHPWRCGRLLRSVRWCRSRPPPLAIVNLLMVAGAATMPVFRDSPLISFAIRTRSPLTMVIYSTAGHSEGRSPGDGERLSPRMSRPKKALNFVDEFENSGRGWFWETNSLGTLSYVSAQLAEDFQCEPEALLGRQFTDLLSVDTRESEDRRGAQDARLPPLGPLSILGRGRPPGERPGRPLVALGQSDLRRPRAFLRLSRYRHRPHRTAPLGAGRSPRLARFNSLTGLPNRAMMRQTLEEALRNAAHRQKGCSMFIIDLDRFKNVNDTLGHPDRRRLAAPGRRTAQIGDGQSWPGRAPGRRRVPGGAARDGRHRPHQVTRPDPDRAGLAALCDRGS